jgi:hypothetical protein
MRLITKLTLAATASFSCAGIASAAVITFGGLAAPNGSLFTGPYAEGGFAVSALSGDLRVGQFFGNLLPSLFLSTSDPNFSSSGSLEVVSSDGGSFNLASFDLIGTSGLADYTVAGFLGAASVFTFSGNQGSPFATIAGNTSLVDRLVFNLTANGTSLNLDNINVEPNLTTAVPEPGTWALTLLGFGFAGAAMRRRPAHVRLKYC